MEKVHLNTACTSELTIFMKCSSDLNDEAAAADLDEDEAWLAPPGLFGAEGVWPPNCGEGVDSSREAPLQLQCFPSYVIYIVKKRIYWRDKQNFVYLRWCVPEMYLLMLSEKEPNSAPSSRRRNCLSRSE